jgi:hypothetical protein
MLVPPLRNVLPPYTLPPDALQLFQTPLQAVPTFPPILERPPVVEVVSATTVQEHANWQLAPPTSTPCNNFSPQIPVLGSLLPPKQALCTVEAFPQAQAHIQADPVPKTSRSLCPACACLVVQALCHESLPPMLAQRAILPAPAMLALFLQFLPAW